MNGNAPNDPTVDAKAASRPAPSAPAGGAPPPMVAGDLDLEVEEIKPPERLKEGFVGQER
jgi:hypothetical protein